MMDYKFFEKNKLVGGVEDKNRTGKYIIIEGIDGAGKTTQVELLSARLKKVNGISVITTVEPTDNHIGKLIRRILSGELEIDPKVMGMLFIPDTYSNIYGKDGVIDNVVNGKTVISDRSYFSTFAYQSRYLPIDWIKGAHSLSMLFKPDIVFYLGASVDTCMNRLHDRGSKFQVHEKRGILTLVKENYMKAFDMFPNYNIFHVNGEESIPSVSNYIFKAVQRLLYYKQ